MDAKVKRAVEASIKSLMSMYNGQQPEAELCGPVVQLRFRGWVSGIQWSRIWHVYSDGGPVLVESRP